MNKNTPYYYHITRINSNLSKYYIIYHDHNAIEFPHVITEFSIVRGFI